MSSSSSNSRTNSESGSDEEIEQETPVERQPSKANVSQFRQREAEADSDQSDEDEDSEEDEDELSDDGYYSDEGDDDTSTYRKMESKMRTNERKRQREEIKKLTNRYKGKTYQEDEFEIIHDDSSIARPFEEYRITLEPSTNTLQLFFLRVKKGKEFKVLQKLFNKIHNQVHTFVFSAFTHGIGSEYIYIEAKSFSDAQYIATGIPEVTMSSMLIVPYKHMGKAMTIPRRLSEFKPGEFVRFIRNDKKGKFYINDIGQVISTRINSNQVFVKLIPRIDYDYIEDPHNIKRGKDFVVPQVDFDERALMGNADVDDETRVFNGQKVKFRKFDGVLYLAEFAYIDTFFRNVEKLAFVSSLELGKKFEEGIKDFERNIPGFKPNMYQALGKTTSTSFRPGDVARILEGHEYENLIVDVKAVNRSVITVVPHDNNGLVPEFEVEAELLEKYFQEGDRVEITAGINRGKVGVVLSVNEKTFKANVHITSLKQFEEVELANLAHTRREEEIQVVLGPYKLEDYVILSDNNDAVIWRIEHDTAHVLLSNKQRRTANLSQIKTKAREQSARTKNGMQIIKGAIVKYKNSNATVLHTGRGRVFLKSVDYAATGGIFVANADEIHVPSTIQTDNVTRDLSGGYIQSRPKQDLAIRGQTVKILGGKFKGHLANVKEATDRDMRVLLHQTQKVVRIERGLNDKNFRKISDDSFKNKVFSSIPAAPIPAPVETPSYAYPAPQYATQPLPQQPEVPQYPYQGPPAYSPTSGEGQTPYNQPSPAYGSPGGYGGYPTYGYSAAQGQYSPNYAYGQYSPSN
jgi:transcription elongation factor SPT5